MKKIAVIISCLCVTSLCASAQSKSAQKGRLAEWEDNPVAHPVSAEYAKESAVILLQDVSMDYRYEGRSIVVYYTLHRIIKVLDDKGIEQFNKVFIPVSHNTRVPSIKARTILPNGRIHDIAKEMIKVTKNEEGENEIVFAMEGVEKNAEIEILLKEIRPLSLFGSENFQYSVPVKSARFEMAYPKELVFEEKGYNGFPDATDTLLNNRRHIITAAYDIPPLHSEPYSFYDLYRMRAEYKIHHINDENENDSKKLYTWDNLARTIYDNHCKVTDKEITAVNEYLNALGVNTNGDEADNIKKIETGIKKNITLYSDLDDDNANALDTILSKKAATSAGFIKLFAACFAQAGVKYELGMASDRREHRIDSKFENWGNLEYYVFYFPKLQKFLSPTGIYYRYPIVPDALLTNKGVFCTIPPKGEVTGAISEIRAITPLPANESQNNITATVSFTKELDATVDVSYACTGYAAYDLRKEIARETKNKRDEIVKSVVTFAEKPEHIIKYAVVNEGLENFYANKPLELTALVSAPQLVEKAGVKYLFRLGAILGPQKELYTDKKRELPIDLSYPNSLNRTITINIPKGYKILNPEAIKMRAELTGQDQKPSASFNANYKLAGDKLVVTVNESYSQIHFPVSDYEQFRKVVNTAADFNKVVLVIGQK